MDARDIIIPLGTINEIMAAVVPYDMVSYIYSVMYRASNGEEMTLGKMFDTLAFHTRGDLQHGPIFDRIVGHIAGLRIAHYSDLVSLTKEMLPHS
jgi:hypothetical protein